VHKAYTPNIVKRVANTPGRSNAAIIVTLILQYKISEPAYAARFFCLFSQLVTLTTGGEWHLEQEKDSSRTSVAMESGIRR